MSNSPWLEDRYNTLTNHQYYLKMYEAKAYPKSIEGWAAYINGWAEEKGWNKNLDFKAQLLNLHSEISEAWEEMRNGRTITEVYSSGGNASENVQGKPEGVPVELGDLLIRLLHMIEYYYGKQGFEAASGVISGVQGVLELKMGYNEKRPYRHGGKTA